MNPAIRAHRILRHLKTYKALPGDLPGGLSPKTGLALQMGETCIGMYENDPVEGKDLLLITNRGIHVCSGRDVRFAAFDEIDSIGPLLKEGAPTILELHLRGGDVFRLPVRGHEGRLFDSFEFLRFFNRVREDLQKMHP